MKIGRLSISGAAVALVVVQMALVSCFAAQYIYQRWTCPVAWTRAVEDPHAPWGGRYLRLQLMVDGCQSTLPSAKLATFPRDVNGAVKPGPYVLRPEPESAYFNAWLKAVNGRLVAVRVEGQEDAMAGEGVTTMPGASCGQMSLDSQVDFFVPKHTFIPTPLDPGQELWMEVTVPPKGSPRPVQLAMKQGGVWKTLGYE